MRSKVVIAGVLGALLMFSSGPAMSQWHDSCLEWERVTYYDEYGHRIVRDECVRRYSGHRFEHRHRDRYWNERYRYHRYDRYRPRAELRIELGRRW